MGAESSLLKVGKYKFYIYKVGKYKIYIHEDFFVVDVEGEKFFFHANGRVTRNKATIRLAD